ncbi:MAG: putative bifunctional diguanylate cyclase/phosphodiesterase [Pseudolabrys sp.]
MRNATRQRATGELPVSHWDRARFSIVVPIGVIVAVAIVCIVVAVLSSAQRADEVAGEHEERLFTSALVGKGQRILREIESVAASESAIQKLRVENDRSWIQRRLGHWLTGSFEHDHVFVYTAKDTLSFAQFGRFNAGSAWFDDARADLAPVVAYLRQDSQATFFVNHAPAVLSSSGNVERRAVVIQKFAGSPALVAAISVGSGDNSAAKWVEKPPIIISIKLIDSRLLAAVSAQAGLANLRETANGTVPPDDRTIALRGTSGETISHYAWTPRRPGAQIVDSVVPYITVAMAGFALLAAFVLRYMRRTAAAIAAGEKRMRHLAMHDPLSGLPNRMYFSDRLDAAIEAIKNGSTPAAVLYVDLDHFKEVNDTLGHHVGDELIRNVTARIMRELREDDVVARLGGDEFAIVSSVGEDSSAAAALAQRLIAKICAPYSIDNQTIVIGASIGIAMIDRHCAGAADIMRFADMALYRAKNEGRNRACIYDMVMDADLTKRKILENDLRYAIDNDQLRLVYQPIVNNSGATVLGVEALCRWTHPTRGEVSPAEFIPVAEHSGLIIPLGEWVLRRACLDGLAWPGLTVAVNVSPLQFRRADFSDTVERILSDTGFDAARLELEITESTLIGNIDSADAAMRRLKAIGVRLALDDFGTGYSSLQYLRRFPFDKLKIDQSFVRSIEKTSDAAAIVHAVVSLGRGLGMKVTAEGVETADQHLFLRAAGVHFMQGYRFGRPDSAAVITDRLDAAPLAIKKAALAG